MELSPNFGVEPIDRIAIDDGCRLAARDPLNRRKAGAERDGDAGKGRIDDVGIQLRQKGTEHCDGTYLPNQWIEPVGVTMGFDGTWHLDPRGSCRHGSVQIGALQSGP